MNLPAVRCDGKGPARLFFHWNTYFWIVL